jgi:hypothetical protein
LLEVIIEKDFACIDRSDKDNKDSFENPNVSAVYWALSKAHLLTSCLPASKDAHTPPEEDYGTQRFS